MNITESTKLALRLFKLANILLINPFHFAVIEPAFDCYIPQILMADGVPLPVPLELSPNPKNSSDYRLNLQSVEEKISSRTKMLVLNNPHNPTGKLFTEFVFLYMGHSIFLNFILPFFLENQLYNI